MMNSSEFVDQSVLPVVSGGEGDAMRSWAQELVSRACGEGVALTGDEGLDVDGQRGPAGWP